MKVEAERRRIAMATRGSDLPLLPPCPRTPVLREKRTVVVREGNAKLLPPPPLPLPEGGRGSSPPHLASRTPLPSEKGSKSHLQEGVADPPPGRQNLLQSHLLGGVADLPQSRQSPPLGGVADLPQSRQSPPLGGVADLPQSRQSPPLGGVADLLPGSKVDLRLGRKRGMADLPQGRQNPLQEGVADLP